MGNVFPFLNKLLISQKIYSECFLLTCSTAKPQEVDCLYRNNHIIFDTLKVIVCLI